MHYAYDHNYKDVCDGGLLEVGMLHYTSSLFIDRNPASPPRVFVLMSFALRFLGRLGETVDRCRARITATSMFLLNRDVELPQNTAASHKVNKLGE